MASSSSEIDEQIERLRKGDTLAENEVKALCEKVSIALCSGVSRGHASGGALLRNIAIPWLLMLLLETLELFRIIDGKEIDFRIFFLPH